MKIDIGFFSSITITLFLFPLVFHHASQKQYQGSSNVPQKILEIDINGKTMTKGLSLYGSDICRDTLYTTSQGHFWAISLKNGKICEELRISKFLTKLNKLHKAVGTIKALPNGFYLSILNELYFINYSGASKKITDNEGDLINNFSIIEDKIIIASRGNKIKLINKNGNKLSVFPLEMADDGHLNSFAGLSYDSGEGVYQFGIDKNNLITEKKYAEPSMPKNILNPTLAFNSEKYFLGFSYNKRNTIDIIEKGIKQSLFIRQIDLGQAYFDKNEPTDEGRPNFKIINSNAINYLALIYHQKLMVFVVNL